MRYICQVLIGRTVQSLDRPFSYYIESEEPPKALTRVLVDFGRSKDCVGFICSEPQELKETPKEYLDRTGIKLSPIRQVLDKKPVITPELNSLARAMAERYLCPLISIYQAMLPPSLKPSESSLNKPQERIARMVKVRPLGSEKLNKNEQRLYERIQSFGAQGLRLTSNVSSLASYKRLKDRTLVEEFEVRINRIRQVEPVELNYSLNQGQKDAIETILTSKQSTVLLQGVTGSGKTLVYMELAQKMLDQGKGSIILVPEIALTDRIASLFKGKFKDKVSILHSELTSANKYDEYLRIREGETQVVVGTRSAIFAPVRNLGLICIDEEQSTSYKQDTTPYYDARMVAQLRATIEGCKIVLGSATPLIEDKTRAMKGAFGYAELKERYSKSQQIAAELVDMSDLRNLSEGSRLISKQLLEGLKETLQNQEQAILFINRRGYAPLIQCRKCNRTAKCANCLIPLTLHSNRGMLYCHRCETGIPFRGYRCPNCDCDSFFTLGYGTERMVSDLQKMLPEARIERLDLDSEPQREDILHRFREGKFDILVGTQMVAKGHDFPKVTLAAALAADQSLAIPSYMSSERTFDLISQLVGRAGRAERPGRAIIQTYDPSNRILILASRQDYEEFYSMEVADRKRFLYPPYCFMCDILISGKEQSRVLDVAYGVKSFLAANLAGKRANIYGPLEEVIGVLNGKRWRKVAVKYKDPSLVTPVLGRIAKTFQDPDVNVTVDIDSRGD